MQNDLIGKPEKDDKHLPYDFADFVIRDNRIQFVMLFNEIAGLPSAPMQALQREFVQGEMDEIELNAFVDVCRRLMAVASETGSLPR